MKHLVTVTLLIETENETGIGEVETDFFDSLNGQLEGLEETFTTYVENPEWDEMAMVDEPSEEEAADGYYQADGDETEEEIEESFTWEIVDSQIEKIQDVPYGAPYSSIYGYQKIIEHRESSVGHAADAVSATALKTSGSL